MNKSKIKKDFLFHLELFYRNFGNQWTINDFPEAIKKHKDFLLGYLKELEQLGIVKVSEDPEKFTIKELPSKIIHF